MIVGECPAATREELNLIYGPLSQKVAEFVLWKLHVLSFSLFYLSTWTMCFNLVVWFLANTSHTLPPSASTLRKRRSIAYASLTHFTTHVKT